MSLTPRRHEEIRKAAEKVSKAMNTADLTDDPQAAVQAAEEAAAYRQQLTKEEGMAFSKALNTK